jgi:hypothetical protein
VLVDQLAHVGERLERHYAGDDERPRQGKDALKAIYG